MADESLESQVNQEYASNKPEYDPRQPQNPSTLSKLGDAFGEMYQNVKDLGSAVRDSSDDYSARRRGAVAGGLATAVGAGLLALGGCDGGPGTDPGNGNGNGGGGEPKIFDYNAEVQVMSATRGGVTMPGVRVEWDPRTTAAQVDTTDSTGMAYFSGEAEEGEPVDIRYGGDSFEDIAKRGDSNTSINSSNPEATVTAEEFVRTVSFEAAPEGPDGRGYYDNTFRLYDSRSRPFSSQDTLIREKKDVAAFGTNFQDLSGSPYIRFEAVPTGDGSDTLATYTRRFDRGDYGEEIDFRFQYIPE